MGRRGAPQDSLTHCMMQRANRQANPSAGKEHKRFRLQTFAQPEYAVFDETLVWCALGSATGGKHVSAISHSSILPIENLKSRNRDRSLKENAPSGLRNRILTISDLKILNQDASGIFQYSLSQSPLWLLASKYSERILSQSSLWLCFQLPSLSLPCSSEPILTFQLQALVPISCIRMQTFSALNVRSHQRRKFSSLTFAYSDDHVLKLTGAQICKFVDTE